jgi:hypothetical protein
MNLGLFDIDKDWYLHCFGDLFSCVLMAFIMCCMLVYASHVSDYNEPWVSPNGQDLIEILADYSL